MWLPHNFVKHSPALSSRVTQGFSNIKWGSWALVTFYISILSGIIVGLQYNYTTPYHSTTSLELLAPFGKYFRSLHFYSSQFFFFFCCCHLLAAYNNAVRLSLFEWVRLIGTFPLVILLLFTGYILRGDNTGSSAGLIAENIILAIPLAGNALNNLFLSLSDNGLQKVYLHHVVTLDCLLLILAWNHLRIYRVSIRDYYELIAATLLFSLAVPAPFDPDYLGVTYISGPWFFLGLQELLRYLPVLVAGVIVPALLLFALLAAYPADRRRRYFLLFIAAWLLGYALFSIVAWSR
ncbi:MAG: cytochrome b N-terminal domain-containing protein [Desulforhopalus sp.]